MKRNVHFIIYFQNITDHSYTDMARNRQKGEGFLNGYVWIRGNGLEHLIL